MLVLQTPISICQYVPLFISFSPHDAFISKMTRKRSYADIKLSSPVQPKAPAPLQIPPSRARRQFALRLAQRKAQLESSRDDTKDDADEGKTQEQEEREGHQRFAKMFEGIDDSSDDETLNAGEGDEEGSGPIEVEGKEVGRCEGKGGKSMVV
jgi:hypothetical protein